MKIEINRTTLVIGVVVLIGAILLGVFVDNIVGVVAGAIGGALLRFSGRRRSGVDSTRNHSYEPAPTTSTTPPKRPEEIEHQDAKPELEDRVRDAGRSGNPFRDIIDGDR